MDQEERRASIQRARATIARVDRMLNGHDITPDLEPDPDDLVRKNLTMPVVIEDRNARIQREQDESEAAEQRAKADRRRQEQEYRELVQVDARIAQVSEDQRQLILDLVADVVGEALAEIRDQAERRIKDEIAALKQEITRMVAVLEAKMQARLDVITSQMTVGLENARERSEAVHREIGTLRNEVQAIVTDWNDLHDEAERRGLIAARLSARRTG
jgi:hypothetical protein